MIRRTTVAHTKDGVGVDEITLSDGPTVVKFLTIGVVTRDWRVTQQGSETSVVLGYEDPLTYMENPGYIGAIAGRVANRVAGGKFDLDGQSYQCSQNEGQNMLHGGHTGLAKRHFSAEIDSSNQSVSFHYHSPEGEEGFPGAVDFTYVISLKSTKLTYELRAESDRPTPINLAQHNYYNLMGHGDIRSQQLMIRAAKYTPTNLENIPTGAILNTLGTRLDLQNGNTLEKLDPERQGIDLNYVLREGIGAAATLDAANGLRLTMETDQPGLQLYTGQALPETIGLHGQKISAFSGLCLEPQHFPNAINQPDFTSPLATPDSPYCQKLTVDIKEMTE